MYGIEGNWCRGRADGDIFGTDYPACSYWRELADYNPDAKVVLSVRDADRWFDSVSETIFSDQVQGSLAGSPAETMMQGVIFDAFGDQRKDRAFMTEWFKGRNQKVIDALPREKLLVYSPSEGWEPLCSFLGVPLPAEPFPRKIGATSSGHNWRAAFLQIPKQRRDPQGTILKN